MKNLVYVVIALIVASFVFMSCEKEGSSGRSIIGSWIIVNEVHKMSDGTTITYADEKFWTMDYFWDNDDRPVFPYRLIFTADGLVKGNMVMEFEMIVSDYSLQNNVVSNLGIPVFKIKSNNGSTLVFDVADEMLQTMKSVAEYAGEVYPVSMVATYKKE